MRNSIAVLLLCFIHDLILVCIFFVDIAGAVVVVASISANAATVLLQYP